MHRPRSLVFHVFHTQAKAAENLDSLENSTRCTDALQCWSSMGHGLVYLAQYVHLSFPGINLDKIMSTSGLSDRQSKGHMWPVRGQYVAHGLCTAYNW